MQYSISRKGCGHFSDDTSNLTSFGIRAPVWCIEQVYTVYIHGFRNMFPSLDLPFAHNIAVALTVWGLDSIHIVDNRFLCNAPFVKNEKVAIGF